MGLETDVKLLQHWRESIDARLWGDGASVEYGRSIEGRLAGVEKTLGASQGLEQAARELRRSHGHRIDRWLQVLLACCAIVTAVAAVVGALAALLGV